MNTTSNPRRRWFLYSLRTLVVLMLLACIGRGWVAVKLRPVKRERAAAEAIARLGGSVSWQDLDFQGESRKQAWLRKLLGDDFFTHPDTIAVSSDAALDYLPQFRRLPWVVRGREFAAWLEDWHSKQKESLAKLVGMLTPNQLERLRQIQLQYALATALADPGYIEALGISQEQLAIIRPLSDHIVEMQMVELRALDRLPAEQRRKRSIGIVKQRDKAQTAANKVALNVLSPQQRVKLQAFTGEEIEVTWDYDALAPAVLFP